MFRQKRDTISQGSCPHGNFPDACPVCKEGENKRMLPENYSQTTLSELENEYNKRGLLLTNTEARFEHHGLSVMGHRIPAEYYKPDPKHPGKKTADSEQFTKDLLIAGLLSDDFRCQEIEEGDEIELTSVRNNVRTGAFTDVSYKGIGIAQIENGKLAKKRYPAQQLKSFRKGS